MTTDGPAVVGPQPLPPAQLARILRSAMVTGPSAVERIEVGMSNAVYRAATDHAEVIVRAHRGQPHHFAGEVWAIETARERGLPVAEVIAVEEFEDGGANWSVLVQAYLPGVPLYELLADGHACRDIIGSAGEHLAHLHQIETDGIGLIDATGRAPDAPWESRVIAAPTDELRDLAGQLGMDEELVVRAADVLQSKKHLWEALGPRLLHGDFASKHVLVSDGVITGILDFELAASGDPANDIAYWKYQEGSGAAVALLGGYAKVEPGAASRMSERIDLLLIAISMSYLTYYGRRQIASEFWDWVSLRLREHLDLLERTHPAT
jgi:aminoglycoside phosphotransferase (APT) family kinase protein